MTELECSFGIDAPIDPVWETFADFGAFLDWMPNEHAGIEVRGDGPGMVRTLVIPGYGRIGERLDHIDPDSFSLSYTLVEGQPLGMVEYAAEIRFAVVDAKRCVAHWRGEFRAAPGVDETTIAAQLQSSYAGMSAALANHVSGR